MKNNKLIDSLAAAICALTLAILSIGTADAESSMPLQEETTLQDPYETTEEDRLLGDTSALETSPSDISVKQLSVFLARVRADDVHISGADVSGHVFWELVLGSSRKIEVQASLRAKTSWFGYSTMAVSERKSVWPGGGRGKAAVARFKCKSTKMTQWYNYGQGFAPATLKPVGEHKGKVISLACGV